MNHHSSTYKLNDQLSLDDLRAYQADQLSGPDRNRVERLMLENPFYADALDGLDALQQVGGSLKLQTRDLHIALQERVHEAATPRRLMPLWVTSMAASVLLVLSVSIYLIFSSNANQKKATQSVRVIPQPIEPGTILIDPADLGTSESASIAPVSGSVNVKSNGAKLAGNLKRSVKKGHHPSAKRASLTSEVTPNATFSHALPAIAEELPLPMVHVETEKRNLRHVDTERAFLD